MWYNRRVKKNKGAIMKDYLVSFDGVYDIEMRIREIDDDYRIFYNKEKNRIEVHNLKNKKDSLVLVSPYNEVDARLYKLVRRTRVERAGDIFKEIEEENERLEKKRAEALNEMKKERLRVALEKIKSSGEVV